MKRAPKQMEIEKFWKNTPTPESGCWEWVGYVCRHSGYGQHYLGGVTMRAHRASWIVHNGPIPKGMVICHHCDNRKCVRPDHLFIGTIADNNRDMDAKGRRVNTPQLGEDHWKARLTERDIRDIRFIRKISGMFYREIAAEYGVLDNYIKRICHLQAWKHVV